MIEVSRDKPSDTFDDRFRVFHGNVQYCSDTVSESRIGFRASDNAQLLPIQVLSR